MRLSGLVVSSLFALMMVLSVSCKKDKLLTSGGSIRFSTDTLSFDTVFTDIGSFTLGLKIFNQEDQRIVLSSVRLFSGDTSYFRLNVNGIPGKNVTDIEIAAKDSIYVFATVKINPRNLDNPFVIEDKLVATLNGKDFSIPFLAYGQDAHYIVDSVIAQTDTWLTDKPYVVLHSALVAKGNTLTLPAGCRVYMHADSRLYVLGRLLINGTKQDSVIFQGDRTDRAYFGYQGYPGEWGGIYFDSTSTGNSIKWAIFRNCGNAVGGGLPFAMEVFGKPGIANQLTMSNTIIENSIGFGLISFQGNIKAENCMIHSTGTQALALLQGGDYRFDNCNFINYFPSKLSHIDEASVAVLNYFEVAKDQFWDGNLNAHFRNCLIYGSLGEEVYCDKRDAGSYNVIFENCLIKHQDPFATDLIATGNVSTPGTIFNQDPKFVDYKKWNFRPDSGSAVIDKGAAISGISNDLDDQPWQSPFDIGAYQYKP